MSKSKKRTASKGPKAGTRPPSNKEAAPARRHILLKTLGGIGAIIVAATSTILGTQGNNLLASKPSQSQCDADSALRFSLEYDPDGLKWYASRTPFPVSVLGKLQGRDSYDIRPTLASFAKLDYVEENWYGGTKLKLVVRARCSTPVILKDVRAMVVKREPPLSGGAIVVPPQGSPSPATALGFDLDRDGDNTAYAYDGYNGLTRDPFFDSRYFSMGEGKAEAFEIHGVAHRYYVEWYLAIDADIQGVAHEYKVEVQSKPIRSTAPATNYASACVWNVVTSRCELRTGSEAAKILAGVGR